MHLLWMFGVFFFLKTCECGQLYNSSIACTRGQDANTSKYYQLNCPQGLHVIVVQRIFYGAPLKSSGCTTVAPKEKCCTNSENDCIFEHDRYLPSTQKDCKASYSCSPAGKNLKTSNAKTACSEDHESIASYSWVEFECVNIGSLIGFCHEGIVVKDKELLLDSNYMSTYTNISECQCVVSTKCGGVLSFRAVYVRLVQKNSTACYEDLTFINPLNSSQSKTITCGSSIFTEYFDELELYRSHSNVISLSLSILEGQTGNILLKIVGIGSESDLHLRCGEASDLEISEEHACETSETSTESTVTVSVSTSDEITISTSEETISTTENNDEVKELESSDDTELSAGVIAAIVLAALAILIIMVFVIIFGVYCKRRQVEFQSHEEEEDYDNVSTHTSNSLHVYNDENPYDNNDINYLTSADSNGAEGGFEHEQKRLPSGVDNIVFYNNVENEKKSSN